MSNVHVLDAEGRAVGVGEVVAIDPLDTKVPLTALVVKLDSYRLPVPTAMSTMTQQALTDLRDLEDRDLVVATIRALREECADVTTRLRSMEQQRDRIAAHYGRLQQLVRDAAAVDAEAEPW